MSAAQLLADPEWYLDALDLQAGRAVFLKAPRGVLEDTPFLDERLDRSGLEAREIAISALAQAETSTPRAEPVFIWHSAFCGSTLLARLLSKPGKSVCLREPAPLAALASLKRHGREAEYAALLKPILASYAGQGGDETVVIKPTNVVTTLAEDVARLFPGSKHLLLTSDAPAFLISIAKKKEGGRALARRMFSMVARDSGFGASPDQLLALTDLQIAALLWRLQIGQMAALQARLGAGRTAWLDGDRFLSDPRAAVLAAAEFFELGLQDADIEAVLQAGHLGRDAKDPGRSYGPEDRAREAQEQARLIGPDLDRIVEWCFNAVPGLSRTDYLNNALI